MVVLNAVASVALLKSELGIPRAARVDWLKAFWGARLVPATSQTPRLPTYPASTDEVAADCALRRDIPLQQAHGAARVRIEEDRRGDDGSRSLARGRIIKGRPCGLYAGGDAVLQQSGNLTKRGRAGAGGI